jgi:hypothetical protein
MKILSLIFILLSINGFAQIEKPYFSDKVTLSLGLEYGVNPIVSKSGTEKRYIPFTYNINKQLSGPKLACIVNYRIKKIGLNLSFANKIKYGHLYYHYNSIDTSYLGASSTSRSINALTSDLSLGIEKQLQLKQQQFSIGLEYQWLNFGSHYSFVQKLSSDIFIVTQRNFMYSGVACYISYPIKDLSFTLAALYVPYKQHRFSHRNNYLCPSFRASYKLKKR